MKSLIEEKNNLRKKILSLKKEFTAEELQQKSDEVMSVLEIIGVFQEAKNIFIYHSMPDEVDTLQFINRWWTEKNFFIPVTFKDEIVFRQYTSSTTLHKSSYGIYEPEGVDFIDYKKVDLVIVPGVAFDRKQNRMGYGKGYYDKFLSKIKAPKVGICFDFQLLDTIPTGENDIKMDYIVSENDLIW